MIDDTDKEAACLKIAQKLLNCGGDRLDVALTAAREIQILRDEAVKSLLAPQPSKTATSDLIDLGRAVWKLAATYCIQGYSNHGGNLLLLQGLEDRLREHRAAHDALHIAPSWMIEWRLDTWASSHWQMLPANSRAHAIQAAREIYRKWCIDDGGPSLRINVSDGVGYDNFDGIHQSIVLHVGMPDLPDSPEITNYPQVAFGPSQEAHVGPGIPVWQAIGTLKYNGADPKNKCSVDLEWATALLPPLRLREVLDALSYYVDHVEEIDTLIAEKRD